MRARRASPHYQFLGHRAHGGGDAEQVGGGGPGGDVEGGLQARCFMVHSLCNSVITRHEHTNLFPYRESYEHPLP